MGVYKEENRKVKKCIYECKKGVNEQFGRKMNEDVRENRKLSCKEVRQMGESWRAAVE